jgi:hypothetical protein
MWGGGGGGGAALCKIDCAKKVGIIYRAVAQADVAAEGGVRRLG